MALGRQWDANCPFEVPFKQIKSENIEEESKESIIISEGSVLFIWGKGDTGCLGFGDE